MQRNLFITSFATPEYAQGLTLLQGDCERLGMMLNSLHVEAMPSWHEATHFKASFIASCMANISTLPIDALVWIDADARLRTFPRLLFEIDPSEYAMAYHRFRGREALSGTVWLANSDFGRRIASAWVAQNSRRPRQIEQRNMEIAAARVDGARILDLPPEYCWIYDLSRKHYPDAPDPVIEHFQWSRRTRRRKEA